jgi:hypothetical protein
MDARALGLALSARRWLAALVVVLVPLVESAKRW